MSLEKPNYWAALEAMSEPAPGDPRRRLLEPYYCSDCGRRFFNKPWHDEACGSSNFERLPDYWDRLDALRDEKKRLEEE